MKAKTLIAIITLAILTASCEAPRNCAAYPSQHKALRNFSR